METVIDINSQDECFMRMRDINNEIEDFKNPKL